MLVGLMSILTSLMYLFDMQKSIYYLVTYCLVTVVVLRRLVLMALTVDVDVSCVAVVQLLYLLIVTSTPVNAGVILVSQDVNVTSVRQDTGTIAQWDVSVSVNLLDVHCL